MAKFEKVSRFADIELAAPIRKTANSAGYDVIPAPKRQNWRSHTVAVPRFARCRRCADTSRIPYPRRAAAAVILPAACRPPALTNKPKCVE